MLEFLIILLVVLWLIGAFAVHIGGIIYLLLVIALVLLVIRLARGERL